MASAKPRRRLIVNADDFGLSSSVNHAVVQAHREGILTSASLMVNGEAAAEAVALAKKSPTLGVGLHLTLCCGNSTLSFKQIPKLVTRDGAFGCRPVAAGFRYFFQGFRRRTREQLRAEIAAQFEKFAQTGLEMDHVNGHLHFHLHPTVLPLLLEHDIPALRLTFDPVAIDWPLGRGRWVYRFSHVLIFSLLSKRAWRRLKQKRIVFTPHLFGLLETGRVDDEYILSLLERLPPGTSELYSHPSLDDSKHEFQALISPRVKREIEEQGIQLIRYQDLWRNS